MILPFLSLLISSQTMDTDEEDQEVPELVHATDEEDEEVTFFPVDKMLHQQVHAFLEVRKEIQVQL